ncbi:hypothetical protein EJ06DRAFT_501714 [Trichodelitschia bisporula]|uniref:Uncharacterized protein n=1 Tax=Trichodelitschia bisporula TaxID=703511 RepID=A0A6G1I9K8_9PEZI|nr:hypothetical protein EJ06DRAFT_501714 [Trichodelitschia bisporula]
MALIPLGVFFGGIITGIPVVTGVAEGVAEQKRVNEEANNETRMFKFYIDAVCEGDSPKAQEISKCMVVLRHDKVWLWPRDEEGMPAPAKTGPAPHPFTGFYIQYPDDARSPPELGLVSTISNDPPMLNWIYVDKKTLELRHGNRSTSIEHIVGPWDWSKDERDVILEGFDGFVVVEEEEREDGLKWAVYYDRYEDDLSQGRKVGGRARVKCTLERRLLPEGQRKMQEAEQEKKLQVKSRGGLTTKWD